MVIGRSDEITTLRNALEDDQSHFIAVYGRRRIGKTFMIREAYGYRFTFQHAGIYKGTRAEQLFGFKASLKDAGMDLPADFRNWLEAFEALKDLIRQSNEKKKVIFIDELSWMDTARSDLIKALENFWNGWASARKDIVMIVCTSATSWMISRIIHNKGGLYNRLTEKIRLREFCLAECEEYVKSRNIVLNRAQIMEYYMIFGGVPYYWSFISPGQSITQNVDRILFAEDAPLEDEFEYLYAAIFRNPKKYIEIIKTLGTRKAGMTREEIIQYSGLNNSGDLTDKLEELINCGFIRKYYSLGKEKKDALYQLIDNYTLFYYQFIEGQSPDTHFWANQINTPKINTWKGLAFERACLKHIEQIKAGLGITGVLTEVHSWRCEQDPDRGILGSQIDLLISRRDQVINLCEIKYSESEYILSAAEDARIRRRISDLMLGTGTKCAIFPTLITPYGLVPNSYAGNIQSVITMTDLFRL